MMNRDEEIYLGEAINYWIERYGSLDLDTPENEILEFYENNSK